jgi:GT2 family glycosyltransferase
MYGEDTDLCVRAWQAGWKCVVYPDARIVHHGGASEKVRADQIVRLFRAKAQIFQKHWAPHIVWFGLAMLKLWAFTRAASLGLFRFGGGAHERGYEAWREVWRRRDEFVVPRGNLGGGGR